MRSVILSPDNSSTTDSLWWLWARVLEAYQEQDGALPENDLLYGDTLWNIKRKLVSARDNAN